MANADQNISVTKVVQVRNVEFVGLEGVHLKVAVHEIKVSFNMYLGVKIIVVETKNKNVYKVEM